jgi:hypothetical protein
MGGKFFQIIEKRFFIILNEPGFSQNFFPSVLKKPNGNPGKFQGCHLAFFETVF